MDFVTLILILTAILWAHFSTIHWPSSLWSFVLSLYYRRVHFTADVPDDDIATLVIANHPNAFVDPFVLQVALNRPLLRTVRADWLNHWLVKWLIKLIGAVPLARFQKDNHIQNRRSFSQLQTSLEQGKWVVIFPEGVSHSRSKLRTFKKGGAHIVSEYLAATGKPIRVLQLALYYSDKSRLHSDIWIEKAGETIYQPSASSFDIAGETAQWQANVQSALPGSLRTAEKRKLNWVNHYSQVISEHHSRFIADPNIWYRDTQISQLHAWLKVSGLELEVLTRHKTTATLFGRMVTEFIILVSGLPLALVGLLLNSPAALLHYAATRHQSHAEDKWASNAYVIGIPLYPLFWLILAVFVHPVIALAGCGLGLYSLRYWSNWEDRKKTLFTTFNCLSQPHYQRTILTLAQQAFAPLAGAKPL